MAYLSQVTDVKVMQQSHHSPSRKRFGLVQPEKAGIVNQGQFESKIRCLEMFDGRQPLDKLRVWTAEQDGYLTVRKATTGEATCTLEKKKGVFVSALLYHDNCMYSGMSDGYIRVYREVADAVLLITCDAGRCPLIFDGDTNVIAKVKPGSAADLAGFAEGMRVTHVQGQPTRTSDDVRSNCEGIDCALTVKTVNKSGEADFELVSEVRKHTGAITCLEVVTDTHQSQDLIFSGGRDWQIYVWGWDYTRTVFRAMDIFPGHQNAVRCMSYHKRDELGKYGGFLYSGGDDNTIRCLDIKAGKERATRAGFPITMRGSVRALAAYKSHLFSATADGLVQVWDSSEGTPITTLFPAVPKSQHTQPLAQLCLVVANNTVWSGGVDGVIRVWRAGGPTDGSDHWQVCELNEHRGAFVNNMSAVQGAADGHVSWHLSEGLVKLLYTESDSASSETDWNHDEGFTAREQELIELITAMRRKMLDNSSEMQRKATLSDKLEKIDKDRKKRIIKALSDASLVTLKTHYFLKLMEWLSSHQAYSRRKALADTLYATTTQGFVKIYFKKLRKFASVERERTRRLKFAETILSNTKKGMQVVYYRKLLEYTNRIDGENKRQDLANVMFSNTAKGLRGVYHTKCIRWYFKCLQNKKRETIATGMLAHSRKGLLTIYYQKLIDFYRKEKIVAKKEEVARALKSTSDNGLRLLYLQKAVRWVTKKKNAQRKADVAQMLMESSNNGLRRAYKKKCIEWLAKKKADQLDAKIQELDEKIKELERLLTESRSFTDEMIEEEKKKVTSEMEGIEREIYQLEKELDDLTAENSRLKNELLSTFTVDSSKSQEEQLNDLLVHLKAHGCSCRYDMDTINQCKEITGKFAEFKKSAKKDAVSNHSPQKLFSNGLTKVRDSHTEQIRRHGTDEDQERLPQAGQQWLLPADTIKNMEPKLFKQAHLGLKYMIIAMDQYATLEPKWKKAPMDGKEEALKNQNWLMSIVQRLMESRSDVVAKANFGANDDEESEVTEATEKKTAKSGGDRDKRSQLKAARKAAGHDVPLDASTKSTPAKKPVAKKAAGKVSPARSTSPGATSPPPATRTPAKRPSVPDSAKAAAKKPVSKPVQRRASKQQ
eukprot:TRINITY_DN3740_c3_g1_i1.p1 TRINITY_DN3740_c3_g1~~TRINITY_DN3740_c3_g1_i1.p1  ORF type:complete len:1113 (+),score=435.22 TRINITY_DN3740_c3_g1_i1:42-3380(+)